MASDARPGLRIASITSMVVELTNTISSQDGNIEWLTYQSTLFPAPATKGEKAISLRKRVSARRQLTFPVDP
jgi:hypothetical protein